MVAQAALETTVSVLLMSRFNRFLVVFSLLMFSTGPAVATTYGVVVTGLAGNADYETSFNEWSAIYTQALRSLNSDNQRVLELDSSATRDDILAAIVSQAETMRAADNDSSNNLLNTDSSFVLMLIGHGTADKQTWRFNIAGQDLTTEDLVAALNQIPVQRQVVVLATSASGATLDALSQPGRVVVTATKSGGEINAVRFPGFLAQALESDLADFDRNEILTVAEAFRFADGRTRDSYEEEKLLASEHARLRGDNAPELPLALLGSLRDAKDNPVVATLLDERLSLEKDFMDLKSRKSEMPVEVYYQELEALLISIATLQLSLDEATGWNENDADS